MSFSLILNLVTQNLLFSTKTTIISWSFILRYADLSPNAQLSGEQRTDQAAALHLKHFTQRIVKLPRVENPLELLVM
ncbi:hypothetical protein VAE308_1450021 [Vibrio aestuarianus]|uniref:Uncharacterized protein n=1 Tax=Vibrio aestuarianus TaxID=28171 RepID=A0ABM9FKH9_9VIBR|nr:hypothetical protein VAE063_1070031 [Vibrio aestuarianus]CAH8230913.1 hypothetical protein VAE308_1450021 [Vibrio aestuarianus]